jgi:hypothetical protein
LTVYEVNRYSDRFGNYTFGLPIQFSPDRTDTLTLGDPTSRGQDYYEDHGGTIVPGEKDWFDSEKHWLHLTLEKDLKNWEKDIANLDPNFVAAFAENPPTPPTPVAPGAPGYDEYRAAYDVYRAEYAEWLSAVRYRNLDYDLKNPETGLRTGNIPGLAITRGAVVTSGAGVVGEGVKNVDALDPEDHYWTGYGYVVIDNRVVNAEVYGNPTGHLPIFRTIRRLGLLVIPAIMV